MFRKYVLLLFAVLGALLGLFMVFYSRKQPPSPPIEFPFPSPPYVHNIAAAGIIEASSENINISTSYNELVEEIYVKAGDKIKREDPLFKLDTREFQALLLKAQKQEGSAITELEDKKTQFSFYKRLKDKRAVSEREYEQSYFALKLAESRLKEARSQVNFFKVSIERSTTRSPIDGEVLQVNIRVGQSAERNPFDRKPLMIVGDLDYLHVRVDIDEEDIWRVIKKAPATAFVRGNSSIKIPLEFVKIEPYVIPKTSLTGDTTERVDMRILQVIYRFKKGKYPVYVGQLLDVYIEALPTTYRSYETSTN